MCYRAKFGRSRLNDTTVPMYGDSPVFQGHSRLSEPARIDWLRVIYCWRFTVTVDLSRAIFEIIGDFGQRSDIFVPLEFNAAH